MEFILKSFLSYLGKEDVTSPVRSPISSELFCRYGDEQNQAISSFSFLENISPESPTQLDRSWPLLRQSEEVSSPTKESNQSQGRLHVSFSPTFDSSSSHDTESDLHGNDPDVDQSPFDVIQSYCELEEAWDRDEHKENTVNIDPHLSELVQSQYPEDDLIVYYDDPVPTSEELLAKCKLDVMSDRLTESAISQSQYHTPRPEHPTVRYLKEESRRESLGRLSSSEDKFTFDEEFSDLSNVCCENISPDSSH